MSNEGYEISHPTFKSKRRRDIPAAERRSASRRGSWFAPVGAAPAAKHIYAFPVEKIKEIYHLRWGIETSFRELKYAIGLTSFHSRKVDYIKQEIYARLLLYNYCELITTHVIEQMSKKDKTKQVNFTVAIYICREYLRHKRQLSPPDVIRLIEKYILPIRPGRQDPRKVRAQAAVSFLYRVA